jgi:hypothetical protein
LVGSFSRSWHSPLAAPPPSSLPPPPELFEVHAGAGAKATAKRRNIVMAIEERARLYDFDMTKGSRARAVPRSTEKEARPLSLRWVEAKRHARARP